MALPPPNPNLEINYSPTTGQPISASTNGSGLSNTFQTDQQGAAANGGLAQTPVGAVQLNPGAYNQLPSQTASQAVAKNNLIQQAGHIGDNLEQSSANGQQQELDKTQSLFSTIFGKVSSPQPATIGSNPTPTVGQAAPAAPALSVQSVPALQVAQAPALAASPSLSLPPITSDKRAKTNIKSANRTTLDFLNYMRKR